MEYNGLKRSSYDFPLIDLDDECKRKKTNHNKGFQDANHSSFKLSDEEMYKILWDRLKNTFKSIQNNTAQEVYIKKRCINVVKKYKDLSDTLYSIYIHIMDNHDNHESYTQLKEEIDSSTTNFLIVVSNKFEPELDLCNYDDIPTKYNILCHIVKTAFTKMFTCESDCIYNLPDNMLELLLLINTEYKEKFVDLTTTSDCSIIPLSEKYLKLKQVFENIFKMVYEINDYFNLYSSMILKLRKIRLIDRSFLNEKYKLKYDYSTCYVLLSLKFRQILSAINRTNDIRALRRDSLILNNELIDMDKSFADIKDVSGNCANVEELNKYLKLKQLFERSFNIARSARSVEDVKYKLTSLFGSIKKIDDSFTYE